MVVEVGAIKVVDDDDDDDNDYGSVLPLLGRAS